MDVEIRGELVVAGVDFCMEKGVDGVNAEEVEANMAIAIVDVNVNFIFLFKYV